MSKSQYRSKPAAMVVTVIALSFALADAAVAETDTVARAISRARVRSIARTVANQQIDIRAPGLPVGSAVSAQSANTANSARIQRTPRTWRAARTPFCSRASVRMVLSIPRTRRASARRMSRDLSSAYIASRARPASGADRSPPTSIRP